MLYIRAWVPESPHWLMRQGRLEEARRSIAWALQIDPAIDPAAGRLAGRRAHPLDRAVQISAQPDRRLPDRPDADRRRRAGLWMVTLFVMVLKISPAEASELVIWVSLSAIAGRFFCSWISDAMGRRASGVLSCLVAALFMSLAGYLHDVFIGGVSMFFVMIVLQNFFGSGNYSIVGPYMGELWPARLRGSGMGFVYGVGNLGKFIGPAGLALIAGSSNFVDAEGDARRVDSGFNYFAFWYVLGAAAFWLVGDRDRRADDRGNRCRDGGTAGAGVRQRLPPAERQPRDKRAGGGRRVGQGGNGAAAFARHTRHRSHNGGSVGEIPAEPARPVWNLYCR